MERPRRGGMKRNVSNHRVTMQRYRERKILFMYQLDKDIIDQFGYDGLPFIVDNLNYIRIDPRMDVQYIPQQGNTVSLFANTHNHGMQPFNFYISRVHFVGPDLAYSEALPGAYTFTIVPVFDVHKMNKKFKSEGFEGTLDQIDQNVITFTPRRR